jgi:hypothetical protein
MTKKIPVPADWQESDDEFPLVKFDRSPEEIKKAEDENYKRIMEMLEEDSSEE